MKFSAEPSYNNIENKEEEIDLREIIFKYLRHWKWFALSIIILLIVGTFIYLRAERQYGVSTSVLLKENKGTGAQKNSPLGSLEELGLLSTTNNIDNEIAVFSSPNLMRQVASVLELQTSYFESGFFRNTEVYKDCPFYVRLEDVKPDELNGSIKLSIKKDGESISIQGKYFLKKDEFEIDGKVDNLPGFIELPSGLGRLYITYKPDIDTQKLKEGYIVTIQNIQKVSYDLAKELRVSSTTKSSSVLTISLDVLNVDEGIDILNEITPTQLIYSRVSATDRYRCVLK